MKKLLFFGLALCSSAGMYGQAKKAQAEDDIKQMCGCYQVDFQYAETFSPSSKYNFHDRYDAHGLEWIFLDEETKDKLVLQHLLVVNDSIIIKHWRQDWVYQNQNLLTYQKNLEWSKNQISKDEAQGTWTQKVYQVDDSPRYEGYAHWVNVDGKAYWESEAYAPLPRREYTKRSDYNVMLRDNRHEITDFGHVHAQNNAKIIRTGEGDSVLVWEKGLNIYTKVDDSLCQAARDWWKVNRRFWVDVRAVWADVIAENNYINLKVKVDDKKLWQRLFDLGDTYAAKEDYNSDEAREKIRHAITIYLSDKPSPWPASATAAKD